MITFIDLFAGIGGFRSGLERAGGFKCIGFCEIDKYAHENYKRLYDTEGEWEAWDITKVMPNEIPKADLWCFGFPCQDISIAGQLKGINKETRSGLFFCVIDLLKGIKDEDKPKWLLIENVKNLLSIDKGHGFYGLLTELDKAGYDAEWCVYNSKDYGTPQNRERVYIVGHFRGQSRQEILPNSNTNTTCIIPEIKSDYIDRRVYSTNGISPTITTQGGSKVIKIALPIPNKSENKINKLFTGQNQRNHIYGVDKVAPTLCASDYKGAKIIKIKNGTKKGYVEACQYDGIDLSYPNSKYRRGRVQKQGTNTVTTQPNLAVLEDAEELVLRRLTPLEYWRLQGFTDEQFNKVKDFTSDTQLYKQAGNAVTVNVVEAIGCHMLKVMENK